MNAIHLQRSQARAGNAILIAMAFIAMLASLIAISSDRVVSSVATVRRGLDQQRVVAAVEAVLARRELMVVQLGNRGDPTEFSRWKENFGVENYGVDFIGNCEVRWKIEPVRTTDKTASGEDIPYIENPSPSATSLLTGKQLANDYIYLFRIGAEARINGTLKDNTGELTTIARAQGVRYASVAKQPLFRYVIFYAQPGAKGDLEMSHASNVNIRGNVHSNGAIYLGSSTLVNTWTATRPSNGPTVIGPDADGNNVFVTGVNGIFRMSKPLMFGAINGYPLSGAAPSAGWTTADAYSLANKTYPTETVAPPLASVSAATTNGSIVNPYRIKDDSGFITLPLSGDDNTRTINGLPLIGSGSLANDSRDDLRSSKWNPVSLGGPGAAADPSGFKGYARTAVTTGRVVRLPNDLTNRPLEVQAMAEVDSDGDPTTDNHEAAKPRFRLPDGSDTTDLSLLDPAEPLVETPGVYLKYALGSDKVALTRRDDGSGWDVTDNLGVPITSQADKVGLVIRERLVPQTSMWPGATYTLPVDPSSPLYLPFAYGKHWRPTNVPYLAMDVTANSSYENTSSNYSRRGFSSYDVNASITNIGNNDAWRDFDMSAANRTEAYAGSGVFLMRGACSPGPGYDQNGVADGFASGGSGFSGNRPAYFFQENWRFLHLRKPKATTTAGIVATYWNDPFDTAKYHNWIDGNQQATLSGPAKATRLEDNINLTSAPGALGVNADRFSGRWEGFFIAPSSSTFQFGVVADDEARVWVNNVLVVSQPNYASGVLYQGKTITLAQGVRYPLVCEFAEGAVGEQAQLQFRVAGGSWAVLPKSQLVTREGGFGFSWKTFRSLQARIVIPAGQTIPPQAKFGIMVRPAEGASPLQNGRDGYAAALFSPIRGFFSQRRILPAVTDGFQRQVNLNFIGSADASSPTITDGAGQVDVPLGAADPVRLAVLTPPAAWTTTPTNSGIVSVGRSSTRVVTTDTWGPWTQTRNNIPGGDGTFLNQVVIGPSSGFAMKRNLQRSVRSPTYSRWTKSTSGNLILNLSSQVAGGVFTAADENRPITLFSTPGGTSAWQNWNSTDYTVNSGTQLQRNFAQSNQRDNQGSNGWINTTFEERTNDGGPPAVNSKVIYPPLPTRVNAAGQSLGTVSASDTIAIMDALYGAGHSYRSSLPTFPNVPQPVDDGVRPAETGTVSDPGFPVIGDPWGGTVSRTFSIPRANPPTVTGFQDVNSYAVTGAHIFPALQEAFLPWQSTWTGPAGVPTILLSVAPLPMTTSFPPTLWRTNPAPQRLPWDGVTAITPPAAIVVNHAGRWTGDLPAVWAGPDPTMNYVVRIRRDTAAVIPTLRCYGYVGPSTSPLDTDPLWFELNGSAEIQAWLTDYQNRTDPADPDTMQLLAGLVMQSGDKNNPVNVQFTDVAITTTTGIINGATWDAEAGGPRDLSRYLASQYQVLWGIYDITEDFFSFGESLSTSRLATEDWIFNPREFWSQSRWWDDANTIEKDGWPGYAAAAAMPGGWVSYNDTTNRQLLAKTTLLTLNMRTLQDYMKTRTLLNAVVPVMTNTINGSSLPGPVLPASIAAQNLSGMFNGLFYAVRTNRYPWNPDTASFNPWGARNRALPNFGAAANINYTSLNDTTFPHTLAGVNELQPYGLALAPPIKPQDFLHAVRLINGSSIDWGYPATGGKFGDSKTSIVTPNQLFVQGNLNSGMRALEYKTTPNVQKETPLAIMGDAVVLLSNRFRDIDYQTTGLNVWSGGFWGTSILNQSGGRAYGVAGPGADDASSSNATIFNTSILTHNAPTTKASVREGQGAPFIDTMMFLESWPSATSQPTMRFKGSLVVMNSRRYTRAFLLDSPKTYGRTPLGITGWHKASPDWNGSSPAVYSAPFRGFDFNYDLLTEEGTPPFTPFGVTAAGVGGYTTILQ